MAQSAVKLRQPADTTPKTTSYFRDFSQPWLDLNDKSVLVTLMSASDGRRIPRAQVLQKFTLDAENKTLRRSDGKVFKQSF